MAPTAHGSSAGAPALTERQQRILETIARSIRANGYAPTMREIGEAVGLQSPSSVSHQLSELERKGYIRKDPKRPRTLWLVEADEELSLIHISEPTRLRQLSRMPSSA